jgi:serine/threonine protein kinase
MFMWKVSLVTLALSGCRKKDKGQCPQKIPGRLTEITIQDPTIATRIDAAYEQCKKEGYSPLDREYLSTTCFNGELIIDGSQAVHIGKLIGAGHFGDTHWTEERTDFVIKLSHESRNGMESMCQEKAAYRNLNGMHGTIPRLHETNELIPDCQKRMLVMTRMGDVNWKQISHQVDGHLYRRMARLLEIIQQLHDLGILHYDIKGDNVRVDSNDPNKVFLIDFGNSVSYVNEDGKVNSLLCARDDLNMLLGMWDDSPSLSKKSWFRELEREVECLGTHERFNYEKWIKCLNAMAREKIPDIDTCPT